MTAVFIGGPFAVGSRVPANVYRVVQGPRAALDVENGGPGLISGVVTQLGVPVRKQVVLLAWPGLRAVASTMSATTGAYSFQLLRPRQYLIVTVDETGTYTPEAKLVTPN